ncbi:sirohydrochlorin chelatase [Nonomuraea typhae]|uniref:sirohydrochlorin chelatase n=1 Tax=Nonomuraea typhae TaxID=2603600 RepID=UPI0012FCD348|nr:CbiX/SirB N-terminal domain-containing protein [Nonomuraea typhae]
MRRRPHGTLVLAAHGTRDPRGEKVLREVAAAVARRRPGQRVELAYLEISRPLLAGVLPEAPGPVTVVPLLLAGGYHAHVDLPEVVARTRPDARIAAALGPHPLLAEAVARRLSAAGLRAHDRVVLAAAGSSDPAALDDVRAAAGLLSVRLGRPVTAAFAAAGRPTLEEAVTRRHRVALASYLLAPGFFHTRLLTAGADLVSDPIGAGPALAALVWHRHDEAQRARKCQPIHHHDNTTSSLPAG